MVELGGSVVWSWPLGITCVYWLPVSSNHVAELWVVPISGSGRSPVVCPGTAWPACPESTNSATSRAQRSTTAWWRSWLSGHSTKYRWLLTTGLAWASSAGQWPSTPYKEVSLPPQHVAESLLGSRVCKVWLACARKENRGVNPLVAVRRKFATCLN